MKTKFVKEPTVLVIAEMHLDYAGVVKMTDWVRSHRPGCFPDAFLGKNASSDFAEMQTLFPHNMHREGGGEWLTNNELLVELAGRKCYDSFGEKAGRKSNAEYIANTQAGDVPHASILYHAKVSFFFAGISRRVSHELIRNYVGADRDEEGAPSQESTRFTHHYGYFVSPPRYLAMADLGHPNLLWHFEAVMEDAYSAYLAAVESDCKAHEAITGKPPTGIERKRIYEAASSLLPHQAETSMIWTTNPAAIAKFCRERDNAAADLEMQRFARKVKSVAVERYPNLFPQPWMRAPHNEATSQFR